MTSAKIRLLPTQPDGFLTLARIISFGRAQAHGDSHTPVLVLREDTLLLVFFKLVTERFAKNATKQHYKAFRIWDNLAYNLSNVRYFRSYVLVLGSRMSLIEALPRLCKKVSCAGFQAGAVAFSMVRTEHCGSEKLIESHVIWEHATPKFW